MRGTRRVLASAQRRADFPDTCHIRRKTGTATDPNTGAVTPTYADIYGTDAAPKKCRFRSRSVALSDRVVGEQLVTDAHLELQIPLDATGVRKGDEVVCKSSLNPGLVGLTFTLTPVPGSSQQTMQRIPAEELS